MVPANLMFCVATIITIIIQIKCTFCTNNRARSSIPPGNMALADIPMFLTFTIDDALHGESHDLTGVIMNHTNRNNQPIPLTYFISNEFTDYSFVQKRYLEGCEIAIHTVTHTTSVNSDMAKWYNEIKQSRGLISEHSNIPLTEMVGFRAPFLEKSDISFQVLNDQEFLYDSTTINKLQYNNLFDWPYTFDIYEPGFVYTVGEGPKQSYPGLWEIPMYYLYKNITTKNFMDVMDYVGGSELLDIFKANFLHRLNSNKSPMGLYFHSAWFLDQLHVDALNDFIEWVLSLPNTWIVNNKDVINWINNPIIASQYSYINNNQLENGKTSFITCEYADDKFWTVENTCPLIIPHDLRYDDQQLFSSEITITSTNDNIIITPNDICVNDTYTIYDLNVVYCSNPSIQDIVRYNDILYKCLWWTTNETAGIEPTWQIVKECIQPKITFIKGIIEPYGKHRVFQDSVLNIDITVNNMFEIDGISVIMDNNVNNISNLSIFEDYEFNINSQTNTANLIIRFIEILHAEYQIEFSFRDLTLSPTQAPTITSNNPSKSPTLFPTKSPSKTPTQFPTKSPSKSPSKSPTLFPTKSPSKSPTLFPTKSPSYTPTKTPTYSPSYFPTKFPTKNPTITPTQQTMNPTINPTQTPTQQTQIPSITPTIYPSVFPTINPSINPTINPTKIPTLTPTINDLCQDEIYTFYDINKIYCADGVDNKFVRYNNALYQCKYSTQSERPDSVIGEGVWLFRKECMGLLSTDVFESMGDQNDEITIFEGMEMSYPVMLGSFIGIGIIILMTMFVCILLCCVILRQKRKYKEKVGEIERIQSVPTLSPGFIPTITKLGSFGSIKDVPPIPIQAIPSNENHYETNQIQIEMSPKSVSN